MNFSIVFLISFFCLVFAQSEDELFAIVEDANVAVDESNASTSTQKKYWLGAEFKNFSQWGFNENLYYSHRNFKGLSSSRFSSEIEGGYSYAKWASVYASVLANYDIIIPVRGTERYTEEYKSKYWKELEIGELYLKGQWDSGLGYILGRQEISWGMSDFFRVVDVLNPVDLRNPGVGEKLSVRIPAYMSRLFYTGEGWDANLIFSWERRASKFFAYGSDFYPYTIKAPKTEKKTKSLKNVEVGASIKTYFSDMDISLFISNHFDGKGYLEEDDQGASIEKFPKIYLLGASVNKPIGAWVLKSEVGVRHGLKYTNASEKKNRFDYLVGLDWFPQSNQFLGVEYFSSTIEDYEKELKAFPDFVSRWTHNIALLYQIKMLQETLVANVSSVHFDGLHYESSLQRIFVEWEAMNNHFIAIGVVTYQKGEVFPFEAWKDNDRILFQYRKNFLIS